MVGNPEDQFSHKAHFLVKEGEERGEGRGPNINLFKIADDLQN